VYLVTAWSYKFGWLGVKHPNNTDIEENDLDHQLEVLQLSHVHRDKSLHTRRVPLPKEWRRANTVIARPLLPNSQHLPASMAPPLLKRQKSSLLNKLSESDRAPSARGLVPPTKSCGDQNIPQPNDSSDQNVPQHQQGTFEVAKRFIEAIVITKNPWPIISDDKYSLVEEAWNLAIEAQNRQRALARAPLGTPSVCQLPGGPSLQSDPQTRTAVSLEFCLMLIYQTYRY